PVLEGIAVRRPRVAVVLKRLRQVFGMLHTGHPDQLVTGRAEDDELLPVQKHGGDVPPGDRPAVFPLFQRYLMVGDGGLQALPDGDKRENETRQQAEKGQYPLEIRAVQRMDEASRVLEGKPRQPECPVRYTRQHIADGKAGGAKAGVHSDFGSRGISRDGNPMAACCLHNNPPSVCFVLFPYTSAATSLRPVPAFWSGALSPRPEPEPSKSAKRRHRFR